MSARNVVNLEVRPLTWVVITAVGIVTLAACVFAVPLGIGLVVVNGVLATLTRGPIRRAFIAIAVTGVVLSIVLGLLLTGVTGTVDVSPVIRR